MCYLSEPGCPQLADVKAAGTYAVIAPQMGKQLVAFQARSARRCSELRTLPVITCPFPITIASRHPP